MLMGRFSVQISIAKRHHDITVDLIDQTFKYGFMNKF